MMIVINYVKCFNGFLIYNLLVLYFWFIEKIINVIKNIDEKLINDILKCNVKM